MPFCPKCKYEYREGIETCPDCDLRLVSKLHKEPREPEVEEDIPVKLMEVSEDYEANIIKATLRSSGIPVMVQSNGSSTTWQAHILSRGGVSIYVPGSKYEQAIRILEGASRQ